MPYAPQLTPEQSLAKLKGPAIGLIVCSVISLIYSAINAGVMLINLTQGNPVPGNDPADRVAVMIGTVIGGLIVGVVPLISLIGSIQMFRGKSKAWSMTGAVSSMLPCSFCCLGGLGFGIWAITVMNQPDVSRALR